MEEVEAEIKRVKNNLKKMYPTNSFIRQINNTTLDNILTDAIKDYAKKYL